MSYTYTYEDLFIALCDELQAEFGNEFGDLSLDDKVLLTRDYESYACNAGEYRSIIGPRSLTDYLYGLLR